MFWGKPLTLICKIWGHTQRRGNVKRSSEDSENFKGWNFITALYSLLSFIGFSSLCSHDPFPFKVDGPLSHYNLAAWEGKEDVFAPIAGTWRCSAVGRLLTSPSSVAATTTVWSPSPTSSRLPLISPCASQSLPLMWWCPSFTYSIFDLSHFIQLNPVEVDSHGWGSPFFQFFSFLLSLEFSKMIT